MGQIPDRRAAFLRDGFVYPIDALSGAEAQAQIDRLDRYEAETGSKPSQTLRGKGHLKPMSLYRLVHHPAVLDAVESVIGPDILCWNSSLFVKDPHDPGYVAWHQDVYDFDTEADKVVTAWVALLPSTRENGAMKVIPRSHKDRLAAHAKSPEGAATMLRDGLELAVKVDESKADYIELAQGQLSLHHMYIHHGSEPNASDRRRCGFAIRYVTPDVAPAVGRYGATLVRGEDRVGRFVADPVPTRDLDPALVSYVDTFGKPRLGA